MMDSSPGWSSVIAPDLQARWPCFPKPLVLNQEEVGRQVVILALFISHLQAPPFHPQPPQMKPTPRASFTQAPPWDSSWSQLTQGGTSLTQSPNSTAAHLGPGEAMVEIVFHLVVLRQAQEVTMLHVHQVLWLRGRRAVERGQAWGCTK